MPTSVSFDGSGYIYDAFGNIRSIPNKTSTAYYPLASKAGTESVPGSNDIGFRFLPSQSITINPGLFSIGDVINIYCSSTISILSGSGVTIRLAGTATTGTLYLAQFGIATLLCVGSDTFVASGGGLYA